MGSYPRESEAVTRDVDDTRDVVHGHQQLSLFNAHYDERCFLPVHVYDTERNRPIAVLLRPGRTPSGIEVRAHVRRLVRHIRARWPKTRILLRGDSHYARPEAMAWCEANGLRDVFGLQGSRPLSKKVEDTADAVRTERATGDKDRVRDYAEVWHRAGS